MAGFADTATRRSTQSTQIEDRVSDFDKDVVHDKQRSSVSSKQYEKSISMYLTDVSAAIIVFETGWRLVWLVQVDIAKG